VKYTPERLKQIRNFLGEHTTASYSEALQKLSKKYRSTITTDGLDRGFKRAGLKTPHSYLAADPLVEYETKRTASEERSQIKDLLERLRLATQRQEFLDALPNATRMPTIHKRGSKREMCAVVLASDWHVEEKVPAIEPFDEYTLEIAAKRVERFFQGIVDLVKHHRADGHYTLEYLCLWLGGDFFTGYLHEDNVRTSQLSPTESMCWLMPRLVGGIRYLLAELDLAKIVIPCSFGNHGRTSVKPLIAAAAENSFEWLMYHTIAQQLENEPRVTFEITKSAHQYVKVYDFVLHFHHGDHVNYSGGVGGIGIPLNKAVDAWNTAKNADYHHIGHWHQYKDFGRVVVNGAMIGYSAYGMSVKARKEAPAQAFYLLDSKRGKCHTTPIWIAK
jgi:hypothetical protein